MLLAVLAAGVAFLPWQRPQLTNGPSLLGASDAAASRRAAHTLTRIRPAPAAKTRNSALTGRVQQTSGEPIANASVCLADDSPSSTLPLHCATTDHSGRFVLSEIEGSWSRILASAQGRRPWSRPLANVDSPAHSREVVIVLEAGGAELVGEIVDGLGGAIPGAYVAVTAELEQPLLAGTFSDHEGRFALSTNPGSVEVCARADSYSEMCRQVDAPREGLRFVLVAAARVQGYVADSSGRLLPNAAVTIANRNGLQSRVRSVVTNSTGEFSVGGLPGGGYELSARGSEFRTETAFVSVGLGEASAPVALLALPAATLVGSIRVAGVDCDSGHVRLWGPALRIEPTRGDGTFEIHGIPRGRYEATAECNDALSEKRALDLGLGTFTESWNLAPAPEDPPESPILASQGASIRGTVAGAEHRAMSVCALPKESFPLRTRTRAGAFAFDDLAPGEYDVFVGDAAASAVSVILKRPGEVAMVQLQAPALADVMGQVVDEDGAPIADAWVLHAALQSRAADHVDSALLTGPSGEFSFPGVPGESYTVHVTAPRGEARATAVAAGPPVLIRVPAYGSLRGELISASGARADVTVHSTHLDTGQHRTFVAHDGSFLLPWLAPGTYRLQLDSDAGSAVATAVVLPGSEARLQLSLGPLPPSSG